MDLITKNRQKIVVALIVIVAMSVYTFSVEIMTDMGYTTSHIMLGRGGVALLLGVFISVFKREPLIPKNWQFQALRFFLTGTSSFLAVSSYKYLSAATVSLINQLDVPLLIFASTIVGHKKSTLQFWLSFWTMLTVAFLALDARFIDEEGSGFILAILSVCIVTFSYFLLKKAASIENVYVISNIFSLSNLSFGIILLIQNKEELNFRLEDWWVFFMAAISQIIVYAFTVLLYRSFTLEKARLPFVISTFVIMLLEMLIENKVFGLSQIGLTLLITGMLVTIILNPENPDIPGFKSKLKGFTGRTKKEILN